MRGKECIKLHERVNKERRWYDPMSRFLLSLINVKAMRENKCFVPTGLGISTDVLDNYYIKGVV